MEFSTDWKLLVLLATMFYAEVNATPCSVSLAFGQSYGGEFIAGTIKQTKMNGVVFVPDQSIAPYHYFEVVLTPKTKMVVGASALAKFASPGDAQAFSSSVVEEFSHDLKITEVRRSSDGEITLYTGTKGIEESIGGHKKLFHTDGLEIKVSTDGLAVLVFCEDLQFQVQQVSEVMGK